MAVCVEMMFTEQSMSLGSGQEQSTIPLRSLMPAGSLLAAIVEVPPGEESSSDFLDGEVVLEAQPYTKLSPDKKRIFAETAGYPHLTFSVEGDIKKYAITMQPLFTVDTGGWLAKMTLFPPPDHDCLPTVAEVVAMLRHAGICYGIREQALTTCAQDVATQGLPVENVIVAQGRLPINGKDACLRYHVEVDPQAGKLYEDGTIDFHERNLFVPITKGQLLATKEPATAGLAGVNIYGEEIPQQVGKDLQLKETGDVEYNQDTGEFFAATSGVLSAINEKSVKVTAKLVLSGDVDFQTGNITSNDAVEIGGSLLPGFQVKAGGDLIVKGSVQSSRAVCQGNVIILGGIFGKGAEVEAGGDIEVPVLANGIITVGGSVHLAREAYLGECRCLDNFICDKQTKIIGCDIIAGGSITVIDVDTDSSPNSFLAAATMPERFVSYHKLLKKVFQAKAAIDTWCRRMGDTPKSRDFLKLQEAYQQLRRKLSSFNVIPSGDDDDQVGGLRYAYQQKITINGSLQSGATLRIGNSEAVTKKIFHTGYFKLNRDASGLVFYPQNKDKTESNGETV